MKAFRNLILLFIITPFFTSCFLGSSENEFYEEDSEMSYQNYDNNEYNSSIDQHSKKQASENFRGHEVFDQKTGMVMAVVPFPSSWRKIKSKDFQYEGPNDIKVSGSFGANFMYGNQIGNYGNSQNRPPMNINQITQEFFMSVARETNRRLINTYELPAIARKNFDYVSSFWQYAPSQKTVNAYGLEWVDDKNMKYLTVVVVSDNKSQYGNYWNFFGQYLQAPSQQFEKAKKQFVYGLANTWYNPEQIAAHNYSEMQKAGIRDAKHRARMGVLKQQGDAQAKLAQTYSDISDISHNGYMKRSGMNDAGHSKSVDGIYGNTTVFNPNQSGQTYKVESYDNYYYGNNQGQVISTDNSLYNPNLDPNVNNQDWTQYEIDN